MKASFCLFALASAIAAAATTPLAAVAQTGNTHINFSAGASFPTGNFGDLNDVGYNLNLGLALNQPANPLGFRVEGLFNQFNSNFGDNTRFLGITGNATYDLPLG